MSPQKKSKKKMKNRELEHGAWHGHQHVRGQVVDGRSLTVDVQPSEAVELDVHSNQHDDENKTNVELQSGFLSPNKKVVSTFDTFKAQAKLAHKVFSLLTVIVFAITLVAATVADRDKFDSSLTQQYSELDCMQFGPAAFSGGSPPPSMDNHEGFILVPNHLSSKDCNDGCPSWVTRGGPVEFISGFGWHYNGSLWRTDQAQTEGETLIYGVLAFLVLKSVVQLVFAIIGIYTALHHPWVDALSEHSTLFKVWINVSEPLTTLAFYIPAWLVGWGLAVIPHYYNPAATIVSKGGNVCSGPVGGMGGSPMDNRFFTQYYPNSTYIGPGYSTTGPVPSLNITEVIYFSPATDSPNLIVISCLIAACEVPLLLLGIRFSERLLRQPIQDQAVQPTPIALGGHTLVDQSSAAERALAGHAKTLRYLKWTIGYLIVGALAFVVAVAIVLGTKLDLPQLGELVSLDLGRFFDFSFSSPEISDLGAIAGTEAVLRIGSFCTAVGVTHLVKLLGCVSA